MSLCRTLCKKGTLDTEKVKGKIVVCLRGQNSRVEKGVVAARAGAAGMILANDKSNGNQIQGDAHFLPAIHISYADGLIVMAYINSTKYAIPIIHIVSLLDYVVAF